MRDIERNELMTRLIDLHHIEKVIGESDKLTTQQKLYATHILLAARSGVEGVLNAE